MTDPIAKPLTSDDRIYEHIPPPAPDDGPQTTEARISAVERQRERERNELMAVLNLPEGQALIFRILGFCNVYSTTMGNKGAEGRRQVGLWLIDAITKADPEMYPQLLITHLKRVREIAAKEAAIAEDARRKAAPRTVFDRLAAAVGLR